MARTSRDLFTTVKTEGGLLPPDFLQRLVEGAKGVDGLSPESYHLVAGEKPSEAASRSWNRLQAAWGAFQAASKALKGEDAGTGLTRDKWLLPLFNELGYGRLQPARTFEIEGKAYPISHLWHLTPIHLIGRNVELDRRSPGVIGAAKTTPHGLLQEFLNRHEGHLWGFVSNGLKLRILRDNKSLTRQAYVEFDLAGMMDGQVYSDFALLFLLCHQSRVEAERAEQCWLEKWADAVRREGVPALDRLHDGVKGSIEALGRGFLAQPANRELVETLRSGALDKQDYYRQLLRTVYRLIFLFVAEDRDLLLTAPLGSKERKRYLDHYSADRLRMLAERRRGTAHPDLWQALKLVFGKLSSDTGCTELGLPALGSFLWSDKATPNLDRCELSNGDLLASIRSLAFTLDGKIRRTIDYRNLGAEELGSVYEALLELHPQISVDAAAFDLKIAAGNEKKTTGSYYTPTSLIECLLDSALEPVLERAAKQPDPEKALLDLKVCDPACGSGHFLIAAAHRMANQLASVRTGEGEPSPDAVRESLRDVVGHCLYGVDINPMAVELCKVNLWLEALEPGRPLSFLEHHIQCGNSLLGATPALLNGGIPGEAFEPLEGDNPRVCRILRAQNKSEREGVQRSLLDALHGLPERAIADLSTKLAALDAIPDRNIDHYRRKQQAWSAVVGSAAYEHAKLVANAWCAAFVWKQKDDPKLIHGITERTFRRIQETPVATPDWMRAEIARLAEEYQFFHWFLAFPGVFELSSGEAAAEAGGWQGGFDVVLGNPPWERVKLQEKEFFAQSRPDIVSAANAAERMKLIKELKNDDPALLAAFHAALRTADGEAALVSSTGRYPLCGRGDVNTYSLFAELNRSLVSASGRAGFIVPSGIATDDTTKLFFGDLIRTDSLASLYSFFETRRVFPGTDSRAPFCLLTIRKRAEGPATPSAEFAFDLRSTNDLSQPDRRFHLTAEDFALLNPNTRTCPIFRSRVDAELTKLLYRRVPVLVRQAPPVSNRWDVRFLAMFHMSLDSALFRARGDAAQADVVAGEGGETGSGLVPLYEAKMFHQFDHRYGDYRDQPSHSESTALPSVDVARLADADYVPEPQYRVLGPEALSRIPAEWKWQWRIGYRRIARANDARTLIVSFLPEVAAADPAMLLMPYAASPVEASCLVANLNSFVCDYAVRQKLGGTDIRNHFFQQFPVLPSEIYSRPTPWEGNGQTIQGWLSPRVLELTYTTWNMRPFAEDCNFQGPPFRWNPHRRFLLRCELDALFFHLYLGLAEDWARGPEDVLRAFPTPRAGVQHVLGTFHIVKRKDESQFRGDYRTKRVILEAFDAMGEAIRVGRHTCRPRADSRRPNVQVEGA